MLLKSSIQVENSSKVVWTDLALLEFDLKWIMFAITSSFNFLMLNIKKVISG